MQAAVEIILKNAQRSGRSSLRRAIDLVDEVLESFVAKTPDNEAASKFPTKTMRKHRRWEQYIADGLRSCGAGLKDIGASDRQEAGRWLNIRVGNAHDVFRRRELAILRFRRMRSLQKFAAVHDSATNHFHADRSLSCRPLFDVNRAAALAEW